LSPFSRWLWTSPKFSTKLDQTRVRAFIFWFDTFNPRGEMACGVIDSDDVDVGNVMKLRRRKTNDAAGFAAARWWTWSASVPCE